MKVVRPLSAAVVEDHAHLREAIAEQLRHSGWEVREFESAEDALISIREELVDVVLTDFNAGELTDRVSRASSGSTSRHAPSRSSG